MIIQDKKIILTGSTGGVGKEIANALYREGAHLLLISKNVTKLKQLKDLLLTSNGSGIVDYLAIDFNDLEKVKESIGDITKVFTSIDVLINNAGIGYHEKVGTINLDELREVFSVNVLSPIILTSGLLPLISRSASGHIINMSSILGSRAMTRTAVYTASKHALTGFSKALRSEVLENGVRVTVVEPGAIETDFIKRTHDPEAKAYFSKRNLIKIPPVTIANWVIEIIKSDPVVCPEVVQIMPRDQIV